MSDKDNQQRERERTPNNRTTTGFLISDELWAVLQPLLPVHVNTHRFGGGRPRVSDRRCADAIFYVLRTGCHWQALDQTKLCAHSTAHDRFQAWIEAGVFRHRSGKLESSSLMSCAGSSGTGSRWTER